MAPKPPGAHSAPGGFGLSGPVEAAFRHSWTGGSAWHARFAPPRPRGLTPPGLTWSRPC